MKVLITIYEMDSRKRERITNCKEFNNRLEAMEWLESIQAKPRKYAVPKGEKHYTINCI